jgi:predicted ATPase
MFACAISARPITRTARCFPLSSQLGRASGFAREDPPPARLEKLEALLARVAPPDEDVAFLADLVSLPASERHPLPNLSPQRKKERILEALIRQLEGLARQQPVLIVFEDAHWIDPTSGELLDLAVERVRSLPVLLIVVPPRVPATLDRPAAGDNAGPQSPGPARSDGVSRADRRRQGVAR